MAGVCTGSGPCVTVPIGPGPNWVTRVHGLPLYIRAIARARMRQGATESEAIRLAVGVVRRWARGEGHVTAATRARAVAALAEWERKKAQAHMHGVRLSVETLVDAARAVSARRVHQLLAKSYPEKVLGWVDRAQWTYRSAVPLSSINMDRRPGGRDPQKVVAIAKALGTGQKMGPVVLVHTSDGLEIADGYHRTLGFKHAGRFSIPAYVGSGVGEHGPWEQAMHDAKLNLAEEAFMTTLDLATGASMAERMMPDRAAVIRLAKKVEAWPAGPRKTAMKATIAKRARALGVKPDGDGDFDMDVARKGTTMAAPSSGVDLSGLPWKAYGVDLAGPSTAQRRRLAAQGKALPGGRFPIPDRTYLAKAIKAVGRAKGDHAAVRRYIHRRAVALGATDMLPKGWKPDGSRTMRSRITRRGAK